MFKFKGKNRKTRTKPLSVTSPEKKTSASFMMALEPRIMFDAAALATADFVLDSNHDAAPDAAPPRAVSDCQDNYGDLLSALSSTVGTTTPATARADSNTSEIAFIDPRVADIQSLIAGIRPEVKVVILDPNICGVHQITDSIQSAGNVSAIHILSHGKPGNVTLGATTLNLDTLNNHEADISVWRQSLTENADILIYGCDVAQSAKGNVFLSALASVTGADVAASADPTGTARLGGNWNLEKNTGNIESFALTPLPYDALLAPPSITSIVRQTPTYETTNADEVTFRVTFSEAVQQVDGTDFTIAPGSVSGATIQLVTPVDTSGGTQFDVRVGGLNGKTGTLNLDISNQQNITSIASGEALNYTNPAGGDAVSDQTYTVDHFVSTPAVTAITIDTGASSTDFITSDNTLVFSGTADPNCSIRLMSDGLFIGSTTSNGAGIWSIDYTGTPLSEGTHNLVVSVTDESGNVAAAVPLVITVDSTAPVITSATVSDIILVLNYSDASNLDAVNKAVPGAFTVRDNGAIISVSSVTVDAANKTVMLTLASAVTAGHTVTVSYTDPTGGNDANAIQDQAGNDAATLINYAVTNNTNVANAAPVISNVSGATWFNKGDNPVSVFSSAPAPALSDADDTYLESATITITTNRQTNDALSIVGSLPAAITATAYNSTTGVLQLTGHATLADYQTALSLIRFANSTGQAIDTDRTITLRVNDGQSDSALASRTMRVLGPKFYMGQTATAYLVGNATGGSGMDLSGINLVMGTITYLSTDFTTASVNAMGFSPVDGHLYAVDNTNDRIIRINGDYTFSSASNAFNGAGNAPPNNLTNGLYSADIDANGIMYMHSGTTTIYRYDLNPGSNTYRTWLAPITMSTNTGAVDMAFNPIDGQIYAVTSNLYRINPTTGATTNLGAITGGGGGNYPMQYFDTNGYLYFTSGGSSPTVYRIDLSVPASPNRTATPITFTGTTLPTSGDGGRIVSINLDFGDAPNAYWTTLASNGPRHSQLDNTTWLGTVADIEIDGPAAGTGTTDDTTGSDDEDGVSSFGILRTSMTSYSVDITVNNSGSGNTTLTGWIDFDRNGRFDIDEAATATVAAGANNSKVTLTWSGAGMSGMTEGATYGRFRIGTTFAAAGTGPRDARSYGPMMDGEVEDYAITIAAPDLAAPTASIVPVSPNPRHTPVGTVNINFTDSVTHDAESVTGVDISDFTLTRDGNPVSLTGINVTGSGSAFTLDLSSVTSPAGNYVLTLTAAGSGIKDQSDNLLATNASATFTVDTTAPVIDLDPVNLSQRDYTVTSVNGASVSLDNNAFPATLVEASDSLTLLTIQPGGLRDGSSEILTFGSLDLMANGGSGSQSNILVGGIAVDITWSSGIFTLTKHDSSNFTQSEGQAVIRDIQYRNDAALLTPGNRTFAFRATDLAGITSNATICTVTATDILPPDAPVITGITNDTGTMGDHITSDITLIFHGTAEANSTVEVFLDGVSKGTTTANGSGAWSFDYTGTPLVNGQTYQVTATSRDASLNVSIPSAAYAVTIDTSAPFITGITNDTGMAGDFRTNDQTLVFFGKSAPNAVVTIILDEVTLGTSTADGSGNWSYDYTGTTLSPGSYVLKVESGGSPADSRTIVIDTSAPLLTSTTPLDNAVAVAVGSNITMTFNENIIAGSGNLMISNGAGDTRTIDINDGTQISISGNTLTIDPENLLLKNMGYYIQLAAGVIKDTSGNNYAGISDTTTFNFTTANTSPPIITNVPENTGGGINAAEANDGTLVIVNLDKVNTGALAGNTLTITWGGQTVNYTLLAADITADLATVLIPKATIVNQGNGNFNVTAQIGSGPTSDPYPVTVDMIAPLVTPTVTPLSTNDTTPTITGTATVGAGETLTVTVNSVTYTAGDGNLSYDNVNKTWNLTIPPANALTEWTYAVTVTVTDPSGNTTSDTTTNELIIDLTLPVAPTVVSQPVTNDNTPTITGTATVTADEYLTVQVNGVTYTEGDGNLIRTSTNWTLTIPPGNALPDGTYNVIATVRDAAGNSTTDATNNELIIDTTSPAVPTVNALTTNDPTPTITGTATVGAGETLTVQVNGVTYTAGDGNLTYDNGAHTWSLTIPAGNTLPEGTYAVTARVTDLATNQSVDATNNEIIISITETPVPETLPTNEPTPTFNETEIKYTGGTDNSYLPPNSLAILETEAAEHTLNYYLFSMTPPPPQEVIVENLTTFNLPPGTFQHTDTGARLVLEATLSDGRPLPDWLKFDPGNGTFTAQPPKGLSGILNVKVTAFDEKGNSASVNFIIHISKEKTRNTQEQQSEDRIEPGQTNNDDVEDQTENSKSDENLMETPPGQMGARIFNFNVANVKGRPSLTEQIAAQGRSGKQLEIQSLLDCLQSGHGHKFVA